MSLHNITTSLHNINRVSAYVQILQRKNTTLAISITNYLHQTSYYLKLQDDN